VARTRKLIGLSLLAAALIQSGALAKMVHDRIALLRDGQEVTLKLTPYDPRSLFQGYYSRLNYEIASIPSRLMSDADRAVASAEGKTRAVYVVLRPDGSGDYQPVSAHLTPPNSVEGAVLARGTGSHFSGEAIWLTYGIESYYLPKDQAAALDLKERDTLRIIAAVGPDGEMAIKRLLVNGEVAYEEPPF